MVVAGSHSLEVQYAGQTISGSPLITEFFDPSKILIEGTPTGVVGELLVLDGRWRSIAQSMIILMAQCNSKLVVNYDEI